MSASPSQNYLIAIGSNQRHPLIGSPARVIEEAIAALEMPEIDVYQRSPIFLSSPLGPSRRTFANAAAIIVTSLNPLSLLNHLHLIEAHFGRERRGQRWQARVLDLDIILWSGGIWADANLSIPHPAMRERDFVLIPAASIAPGWCDPLTSLTLRQLLSRLTRPKPLDPSRERH